MTAENKPQSQIRRFQSPRALQGSNLLLPSLRIHDDPGVERRRSTLRRFPPVKAANLPCGDLGGVKGCTSTSRPNTSKWSCRFHDCGSGVILIACGEGCYRQLLVNRWPLCSVEYWKEKEVSACASG